MADDENAITRVYAASVAALNARDVQTLAGLYTEDAVQLPPDRPPLTGWKAIRSSLDNELRGIGIEAGVEIVEIVIAGSWAYARGRHRVSVTPKAGGPTAVTTGSWLDILKRQFDGSWRIARSAWSDHEAQWEER